MGTRVADMAQGNGDPSRLAFDGRGPYAFLLERAYLYLLFHKLFGGYPNERLAEMLLGETTCRVLERHDGDDAVLLAFRLHLGSLADRNRKKLLRALSNEYAQMFVGPMALPAFPYESPYLTSESTLFQENTERVRRIYRAQGLLPRGYLHVPDDHIALMCDFMARLARMSYRAAREGDGRLLARRLEEQRGFLASHMVGWISEYAVHCRIMRSALLYPQAVEAFAAFIRLDGGMLAQAAEDSPQGLGGAGAAGEDEAAYPQELERAYHDLGMLQLERIDGYELDRIST